MTNLFEGVFESVENDPLWQRAGLMVGAPPRPPKGYVTVSLGYLARVMPMASTPGQLVVALMLYRECLVRRSNTVALTNGELRKLGISRQTKYRALRWLEGVGAVTAGSRNGRSTRITLLWFP